MAVETDRLENPNVEARVGRAQALEAPTPA